MTMEDEQMVRDLVATMMAGFKGSEPATEYPDSHSDMTKCARAVLRMFDVARKALV